MPEIVESGAGVAEEKPVGTTEQAIIISHFDISPANHEHHPRALERFVESFAEPLSIWGGWDERGARVRLGSVVRVEISGQGVLGDITWTVEPPDRYVHMNWAFGPGERVSMTSGFVSPFPHHQDFAWVDDDIDAEREGEDDIPC